MLQAKPNSSSIKRDEFGVPTVRASAISDAWEASGYAVAEDRLWQMETSRHLARGTLASILGSSALASDIEVAKSGYTTEELQAQYDQLSEFSKVAMRRYADGVNRFIRHSPLPIEFSDHGHVPTPWDVLDSVAIAIRLFQEFGKGGAGELRNLAFLQYAKTQPKLKGRELDAFDDFAWQNDPSAATTIAPADDVSFKNPPVIFAPFDRSITEARLGEMQIPSLFELLPSIMLAERHESRRLAENLSVPFRTGSYCVVVPPRRSKNGHALLLSGPQMGFRSPSILHEISINAPGLQITGADVPGVPGVVVGKTDHFAWGVTSGVADTEDIVWSKTDGSSYVSGGKLLPYWVKSRVISVNGSGSRTVSSKWTVHGPVVLESTGSKTVFSRHSAYRGKELRSFDALLSTYGKSSARNIDAAISAGTMSFNYFFATDSGDIGYRFVGLVPMRAPGLDPRLPTPDKTRYDWRGFVPPSQMPHVINPKRGLLANWNNKPTVWWPNGDTPVWGRIQEADSLFLCLQSPKFSVSDLGNVVERIAKQDPNWQYFGGLSLVALAGPLRQGAYFSALQDLTIRPTTGGFLDPQIFQIVVQPTLVWNALNGLTKLDYLSGRSASQVETSASQQLESYLRPAQPVRFGDLGEMPFVNRGTYIQIVDVSRSGLKGVSVLPPGEAASGLHSGDQLHLANIWAYKRMAGSRD